MDSALPTVVLVDDSSTVQLFFQRVVSEMNVNLRSFVTAADCMEFLREETPALLFLDIILPGKDGLTFLAELRRDPRHRETAVVVITSKDYAQDRMTAKQLGALEFVAKPMRKQTIRELIERHARPRTAQAAGDLPPA